MVFTGEKMDLLEKIIGGIMETVLNVVACEANEDEILENQRIRNSEKPDTSHITRPPYNATLGSSDLPVEPQMDLKNQDLSIQNLYK